MKKIFTSILFAAFAISATAQKIAEGYYHIMNNYTGRYLTITSRQGSASAGAATADLHALETLKPLDEIAGHPGSCIYIKNVSGDEYE